MSRNGRVAGAAVVALVALLGAWAAWNYMQNAAFIDCEGPSPLLIVLDDNWTEDNAGIYEQTTIAWAPSILIREEATASVVTRYWGTPPANLAVQYEGGEWFGSTAPYCWQSDGIVGTTGYGLVPSGSDQDTRAAPILGLERGGVTGSLSDRELRALKSNFGPAQTVQTSLATRVWTTLVVWWPIVLIAGGAVSLLYLLRRFRRAPDTSKFVGSAPET